MATFLTCFRGERRKYAGKKVRLNGVSNSQPPGHESDALTNERPRRALCLHQKCHVLTTLEEKPFENILGKGEDAGTAFSHF